MSGQPMNWSKALPVRMRRQCNVDNRNQNASGIPKNCTNNINCSIRRIHVFLKRKRDVRQKRSWRATKKSLEFLHIETFWSLPRVFSLKFLQQLKTTLFGRALGWERF